MSDNTRTPPQMGDAGIGADSAGHSIALFVKSWSKALGVGALVAFVLLAPIFFALTSFNGIELAWKRVSAQLAYERDRTSEVTYHARTMPAGKFLSKLEQRPDLKAKVNRVTLVLAVLLLLAIPIMVVVALPTRWMGAFLGQEIRTDEYVQGVRPLIGDAERYNEIARRRRRGATLVPTRLADFLTKHLT